MKKSTLSGITAVLLAGVLAGGVCVAGYASRNDDGKWFANADVKSWHISDKTTEEKPNEGDEAYAVSSNMIIQQKDFNGVRLRSAPMLLSAFEDYGISTQADSVQMLTATLEPADATYQAVDFTVAWQNGNSSWANGKDINDYITVSQGTDGALQCAVSCLQPFGETAIITCTARPLQSGAWSPSATCTVGYYKRADGISEFRFYNAHTVFDDEGNDIEEEYETDINFLNGVHTFRYENEDSVPDNFKKPGISITFKQGVGTYNSASLRKSSAELRLNSDLVSAVKAITGKNPDPVVMYDVNWKSALNEMFGSTAVNDSGKRSRLYNLFAEKYNAGQSVFTFVAIYEDNNIGERQEFSVQLKFNPLALGVSVNKVILDKDHIMF